MRKQTSKTSGMPCPFPNQPRSPPRLASGAMEARLATAAKEAGLRRTSSRSLAASSRVRTTIWRAWTRSGSSNSAACSA